MTMVCPVCKRGGAAWISCQRADCTDGRNLVSTTDDADKLAAAQAEIERLGRELNLAKYGEPDFSWSIHKEAMSELQARAEKAEAERDAIAAAAFEAAANIKVLRCEEGGTHVKVPLTPETQAAIRSLATADASARLAQMLAEAERKGMQRAADLYPQGIATILAAMQKEGGE